MPIEDAEMTRAIRREISRRYIDATNVDVRVIHGVVYLKGYIETLRTHQSTNLSDEMEIILRILRTRPGIRDVINEVDLGRPGLRDSVRSSQKGKGR